MMTIKPKSRPKRRRRDPLKTKREILDAARNVFAQHGYSQTSLRDIAKAAGDISSSQLVHHFGTKAALFEAALMDLLDESSVFEFDRAEFGAKLVEFSINPGEGPNLASMIALSTGDRDARIITARFTEEQSISRMAKWLGGSDAHARAVNITMISLSLALFGHELPFAPLPASTIEWAVRTIQLLVDETGTRLPSPVPTLPKQIAIDTRPAGWR